MSETYNPPKSPTLLPPRKSVELEDPGAHNLENSEAEDDVFSDAPEDRGSHSGPSSTIPTTRVEKVDDRDSHGEVPGTAAYKIRTKDAVPDELEVIPDGSQSSTSPKSQPQDQSSGRSPIPKTVVEKVDTASPSHGGIARSAAHAISRADAVPDEILQASSDKIYPRSEDHGSNIVPERPVPTTVVTRIDSEPSHGEVPNTDAFEMRKGDAKPDVIQKKGAMSGLPTTSRSKLTKPKPKPLLEDASSIAADGGFGPMDDGSENESIGSEDVEDDPNKDTDPNSGDSLADDFDDFEAGAEGEDFGDFDEGFQDNNETVASAKAPGTPTQSLPPSVSPFPLLDFSELATLDDIIKASNPYLKEMFPSTKEQYPPAPSLPSNQNSIFLTDRSLSLWFQLVAPPPLQPPNWVRSRIRRLFLVSLGVPVDLDEILPASKQKKLILPSVHLRSGSQSPPEGRRPGSRVRLKQDNASVDQNTSAKASKKRKGPPSAPELDLQATKMLCATTEAALSSMTHNELQAHVKELEELTARASEVLEYWLKRRDSALGDKDAFEGVIENLVKHARRVRK